MSPNLARLKQIESKNNSDAVPNFEPAKPAKVPFDPFGGSYPVHIEKKSIDALEMEISGRPSDEIESPLEQQEEIRRLKVIAMLDDSPGRRYSMVIEDPSADPVIITVGIKEISAFELEIPNKYFDTMLLLNLIKKHIG